MVYFPKPGLIKEQGSELFGSILYYFVGATVVAVSGGSLAFVTNGTATALANAGALMGLIMLLPFVLYSPINVLCMIANDLICWARGYEGPIYILRYISTLIMQLIAAVLAALLTLVFVAEGNPTHLGIPRVPSSVSDIRAFFSLAIATWVVTLVWLIVSENTTSLYSYGMAQLRISAEKRTGEKSRDAWKNTLPNKGQIHLFMASLYRGLVMFGFTLGAIYLLQPVAGYVMNPTMYLGYALVSWTWDAEWWIHLLAPFVGGFVAYLMYLPYTFSSNWGPLTKYYGRRRLQPTVVTSSFFG